MLSQCLKERKECTRGEENKRDAIGFIFYFSRRKKKRIRFFCLLVPFPDRSACSLSLSLFRRLPRTTVSPPSLALENECVLSTCRSVIVMRREGDARHRNVFSFFFSILFRFLCENENNDGSLFSFFLSFDLSTTILHSLPFFDFTRHRHGLLLSYVFFSSTKRYTGRP